MSNISVGSLFAGIGGLELGLERAGMEVRWQVENDDYATRVLAKHWPDVARYRDVRDVGKHNLEPVDLICGGFPCQDVSLAGQRAGLEGKRSTLWGEFARIIRELRPRWVLAENVCGLLSANSGRFFGTILRDLAQAGYDAEWQSIPAAAVGAPHIRRRVFIVAYPNRERQLQPQGVFSHERRRISDGGQDVSDASCRRYGTQEGQIRTRWNGPKHSDWWATEPAVGRLADGIPARVERLRCLGNAVVPQVAEYVGRMIVDADARCDGDHIADVRKMVGG